jgi:prevent-host-death family protein
MTQVSIHEAKTHLSRLIEKVMRGEEVIISKRNRPVVRLVLEKPQVSTKAFGA